MRHCSLGIVLLVVGVCGLPGANAAPIDYTITFQTTGGVAPTAGSFTYDSNTPIFSNFLVEWAGFSYDITFSANNPLLLGTPPCLGGAAGPTATFAMLSGDCNGAGAFWEAVDQNGEIDFVRWKSAPTNTSPASRSS